MSESAFPIGRRIMLPGHFAEPVVLESVRPLGDGCECRVRLADGSLEEVVLSPEETRIIGGHDDTPEKCRLVDATDLQLLVESARIRLAYTHDRQFAVSLSGIRTLPHQIEAVYQRMLPQPCLRFLLADDPGAGKTIMAGLLIKELRLREAVDRVLILCPAPLTIQWQDELQRWFGETFDIIFAAVDQQQLSNPWQRSNHVIASLDYAKQEDVRERIWQQHWDLVIIDEAHKCSARPGSGGVGREPKIVSTRRYDLAAKLASQCDNLLLLTATPHHGDEDKFAHFLRLIDHDLFPEPHRLGPQASEIRNDVFRLGASCPWALRRLKEDLKDMDGQRLFPDRHAVTVPFMLNPDEFALYKAVTQYINQFIPQQQGQRKTSAALARTVLQRRLASSACAIHESLKRRLQKQQDLLDELEGLTPSQRIKRLAALQGRLADAEQEEDDLDDSERDHLIDEFTAANELDQLRAEIAALKDLIEDARRVRESANDSKLKALKSCLEHTGCTCSRSVSRGRTATAATFRYTRKSWRSVRKPTGARWCPQEARTGFSLPRSKGCSRSHAYTFWMKVDAPDGSTVSGRLAGHVVGQEPHRRLRGINPSQEGEVGSRVGTPRRSRQIGSRSRRNASITLIPRTIKPGEIDYPPVRVTAVFTSLPMRREMHLSSVVVVWFLWLMHARLTWPSFAAAA
jgi:hypothetical protein